MVGLLLFLLTWLQQDQVAALKAKSIKAECFNSSMAQAERTRVATDLKAKSPNTKLLYVTPELIATTSFLSTLHSLDNRGLLSSVAVDEVSSFCVFLKPTEPLYQQMGDRLQTNVPPTFYLQTKVPSCTSYCAHSYRHKKVPSFL